MKQILRIALLTILCSLLFCSLVSAQTVTVLLDGNPLTCRKTPVIENNRVLVPLRDIMEPLGYTVIWNEADHSIHLTDADSSIDFTINHSYATVNQEQVVLDAAPRIMDDITMVPLRFLADYSGASITWQADTYTVVLKTNDAPAQPAYTMADSVVYIQTNKIQGSGIILSADGLIATNYHVIEQASTAQIIFRNNTIYQGAITVVGMDPQADIALLKIDKTDLHPVIPCTDIVAGETVTTVSAPNGNRNVSTTGSINGFTQDIISMTAPIQHGSSGGGLFNADGEVIGMCSAYSEEQYFAIPIQKVLAVHQTMSLPLNGMKNYAYTPGAPRNVSYTSQNGYDYFTWEPVYGADYYYIYIASQEGGTYQQMTNTALHNQNWYWNYPYAFGVSLPGSNGYYIRVASVKDGVICGTSDPLYVPQR